jgi:hypothetical protein
MKLTDKTVPALTLPAGKSEVIYFDDRLAGSGSGCVPAARDGFSNTARGVSSAA